MTDGTRGTRSEDRAGRSACGVHSRWITLSLLTAIALAAITADAPARDLVVPEPGAATHATDGPVQLPVPVIEQARQRCGPAALQMVMRYYGAGPEALFQARTAYDPVLRGSLITELASAARRAGFEAAVVPMTADSLVRLLRQGVPPILLYQNGRAPFTVRHYGVVTGWDDRKYSFTLNDGTAQPQVTRVSELVKRWAPAGSQALIIRPRQP